MVRENSFFLDQLKNNLQKYRKSERIFLLDDFGKIKQKTNYYDLLQSSRGVSLFLTENRFPISLLAFLER